MTKNEANDLVFFASLFSTQYKYLAWVLKS